MHDFMALLCIGKLSKIFFKEIPNLRLITVRFYRRFCRRICSALVIILEDFLHTICPSESTEPLFSCCVFAVKLMLLLLTLPEHLVWKTIFVLFQTLVNWERNVTHHFLPSSHVLSLPENMA